MEPMPIQQDQTYVYARASDLLKIMRTPADRINLAKELSKNNYIILRLIFPLR